MEIEIFQINLRALFMLTKIQRNFSSKYQGDRETCLLTPPTLHRTHARCPATTAPAQHWYLCCSDKTTSVEMECAAMETLIPVDTYTIGSISPFLAEYFCYNPLMSLKQCQHITDY